MMQYTRWLNVSYCWYLCIILVFSVGWIHSSSSNSGSLCLSHIGIFSDVTSEYVEPIKELSSVEIDICKLSIFSDWIICNGWTSWKCCSKWHIWWSIRPYPCCTTSNVKNIKSGWSTSPELEYFWRLECQKWIFCCVSLREWKWNNSHDTSTSSGWACCISYSRPCVSLSTIGCQNCIVSHLIWCIWVCCHIGCSENYFIWIFNDKFCCVWWLNCPCCIRCENRICTSCVWCNDLSLTNCGWCCCIFNNSQLKVSEEVCWNSCDTISKCAWKSASCDGCGICSGCSHSSDKAFIWILVLWIVCFINSNHLWICYNSGNQICDWKVSWESSQCNVKIFERTSCKCSSSKHVHTTRKDFKWWSCHRCEWKVWIKLDFWCCSSSICNDSSLFCFSCSTSSVVYHTNEKPSSHKPSWCKSILWNWCTECCRWGEWWKSCTSSNCSSWSSWRHENRVCTSTESSSKSWWTNKRLSVIDCIIKIHHCIWYKLKNSEKSFIWILYIKSKWTSHSISIESWCNDSPIWFVYNITKVCWHRKWKLWNTISDILWPWYSVCCIGLINCWDITSETVQSVHISYCCDSCQCLVCTQTLNCHPHSSCVSFKWWWPCDCICNMLHDCNKITDFRKQWFHLCLLLFCCWIDHNIRRVLQFEKFRDDDFWKLEFHSVRLLCFFAELSFIESIFECINLSVKIIVLYRYSLKCFSCFWMNLIGFLYELNKLKKICLILSSFSIDLIHEVSHDEPSTNGKNSNADWFVCKLWEEFWCHKLVFHYIVKCDIRLQVIMCRSASCTTCHSWSTYCS